jgi:hypothetical protein
MIKMSTKLIHEGNYAAEMAVAEGVIRRLAEGGLRCANPP